jgi:hypothetical protein
MAASSLHQCNLFLPASIRMWVRSSTRGIRRDEVSMSRFSLSHLHSCSSSSLIRLEGVVVDHHAGAVYFVRGPKIQNLPLLVKFSEPCALSSFVTWFEFFLPTERGH